MNSRKRVAWLVMLSFFSCCKGIVINIPGQDTYLELNEEQPIGTTVAQARNEYQVPKRYELTGDGGKFFAINSMTGSVTIIKKLDREGLPDSKTLLFVVTVHELAGFKRQASVKVTVVVLDINDHAPQFLNSIYNVTLNELTCVGTVVFSTTATDKDTDLNGQVTYTIAAGNEDNTFAIEDFYKCEISLNKPLDYKSKSLYSLNITAKDGGGLVDWIAVNIHVKDGDNLAAKFTSYIYYADISEDALEGTQVYQVTAHDQDKTLNATVTYEIDPVTNPSNLFAINNLTGVISLNGILDRENVSAYTIQVLARSTHHHPDHAAVLVTVTDVDDNPLVFTRSHFIGRVAENSPIGTTVLRVQATDNDKGSNVKLTYHLVGGNEKFAVNHATGYVTVNGSLDREVMDTYTLTVFAAELLPNQHNESNASANVTVQVLDLNDNSPVFSKMLYHASVDENLHSGAFVINVTASDSDLDINAVMTYELVRDVENVSQPFTIDPLTGTISTSTPLDRENTSIYSLVVRATDGAATGQERSSLSFVRVAVTDDNDNPPQFDSNIYTASISEKAGLNTIVTTVKATDKDEGNNAVLRYSIDDGNIENYFGIETDNGTVYVNKTLDRETRNKFLLLIKMTDVFGNYSDSTTLGITVEDFNDNGPVFENVSYSVDVFENVTVGSKLLQVKAIDPDVVQNVHYSIVGGNDAQKFMIDSCSGTIYIRSGINSDPPDSEELFKLVVTAKDKSNVLLNSSVNVTVRVMDVNDHHPLCYPDPFTLSVLENATVGSSIGELHCSDLDSGQTAKFSFKIMTENDQKPETFVINNSSGKIFLSSPLDRDEGNKVYALVVQVSDDGDETLHTNVTVVINVLNVNDNTPMFQHQLYTFRVYEGVYKDTPLAVGQVRATDEDADGANSLFGQLRYSIVNSSGELSIDQITGLLSTTHHLDREVSPLYTLTVQATDQDPLSPRSNTTTVVVHVADQNDNSPAFPANKYFVNVSEAAPVDQVVVNLTATDLDEGSNGNVSYSLFSGNSNGEFQADPITGEIKVAKRLDREKKDSFSLIVQAKDGGLPYRSSVAMVTINILDVNDHLPVCTKNPFMATVRENLVPGQFVVQVVVTDEDVGVNEKTTFTMNNDTFGVDKDTGVVSTMVQLDRESVSTHNLTVNVHSAMAPSQPVNCTVIVKVTDDNDHAPVFSKPSYSFTIMENSTIGSHVAQLSATDDDIGPNAKIMYSLIGGEERFTINSTTGVILIARPLDRESAPEGYILHVIATDKGFTQIQTSTVTVRVNLGDVNDNPPLFDRSFFIGIVLENSNGTTIVAQVSANDADQGNNSRISYSITGGNTANVFSINSTGAIVTTTALDRETRDNYELTVRATDHGAHAHLSSVKVLVSVTDTNDNAPNFTNVPSEVLVSESTLPGTMVFILAASDKDLGRNAEVRFQGFAVPGGVFHIDTRSGAIVTTAKLDRELQDTYTFYAMAVDMGNPPLNSSMASFTINVTDVNDNSPVFTPSAFIAHVSEGAALGTSVVRVNASEKDQVGEVQLCYRIVSGDPESHFEIDNKTGTIAVVKGLDRETQPTYQLVVTAQDQGRPPRLGHGYVSIYVTDVNDRAPVFQLSRYQFTVRENAAVGSLVAVIRAVDGDLLPHAKIDYSITGGQSNGEFKVLTENISVSNAVSFIAEIMVGKPLDREKRDRFNLTIVATDGVYNDTSTVLVTIMDVNDNAPVFVNSSKYEASVQEDTPGGKSIFQVVAHDDDIEANAKILYSIEDHDDWFFVDKHTGVIYTSTRTLDRETKHLYNITVVATDSGGKKNTTQLYIHVTDVNDNHPVFRPASYHVTIAEGPSSVGLLVADVNATDQDLGRNKVLTYRILNGGLDSFAIDENTGVIKLRKSLDREKTGLPLTWDGKAVVILHVEAADHGSPKLRNSTKVTVHISDINDHPPMFVHDGYSFTISEDSGAGTFIGALEVTDKDLGQNAEVFYKIVSDGPAVPFQIQNATGVLTVKDKVDRENQDFYTFAIMVQDKGSPSLNSTATVNISITDTNDNSPAFNQSIYRLALPENVFGGYKVMQLSAVDPDLGDNSQVKYFIVGGSDEVFIIEESTGIVRTALPLDYEAKNLYTLNVSARDEGTPSLVGFTSVIISVTDYNDLGPVFNAPSYSVAVPEDVQPNTTLVIVFATDPDLGIRANITYSLLDDLETFGIDEVTGVVTSTARFDRETRSSYRLVAVATDQGSNRLSAQTTVLITVLDTNDNRPLFQRSSYTIPVGEDTGGGLLIERIQATDKDTGENAQLTYSIVSGNGKGYLAIDNTTGDLTLTKTLKHEANNTHTLVVMVTDGGSPQLNSSVTVSLVIVSRNKHAPELPKDLHVLVNESAPIGTVVTILNASDVDRTGMVRYTLLGGDDGRFAIGSLNGVVSTTSRLDRESKPSYTLIVMARDTSVRPYSDYGVVTIDVIDVNDNPPQFTQARYVFEVVENAALGSMVGQLSSTDSDERLNAVIRYSIPGEEKTFAVNSSTGEITVKRDLDRELRSIYSFAVKAENVKSVPRLHSNATVVVNVIDANDKKPKFNKSSYHARVSEAAVVGTAIIHVNATDKDLGLNAKFLYSILYEQSSVGSKSFVIDPERGTITTRLQLDREEHQNFTLMVQVRDVTGPSSFRDIVPVYIDVDDINDNHPRFVQRQYKFTPKEDAKVNDIIGNITATDADEGVNSKVTYDISKGNDQGFFRINKNEGIIYLNRTLEHYVTSHFNLVIRAYDGNFVSKSKRKRRSFQGPYFDEATVFIVVQDSNNNPPFFTHAFYIGGFYDRTPNVTVVSLKAVDKDSGYGSVIQYLVVNQTQPAVFTVEPFSGQVTWSSQQNGPIFDKYVVNVTARDNGGIVPFNEAPSYASVYILYLTNDDEVVIALHLPSQYVQEKRDELKAVLKNLTGAEIFIKSVQTTSSTSSTITFHAVNITSFNVMSHEEVLRILQSKRDTADDVYRKWNIIIPSLGSSTWGEGEFSAVVGAMMFLAAFIGLAGIVSIIVACVRNRSVPLYRLQGKRSTFDIGKMESNSTIIHNGQTLLARGKYRSNSVEVIGNDAKDRESREKQEIREVAMAPNSNDSSERQGQVPRVATPMIARRTGDDMQDKQKMLREIKLKQKPVNHREKLNDNSRDVQLLSPGCSEQIQMGVAPIPAAKNRSPRVVRFDLNEDIQLKKGRQRKKLRYNLKRRPTPASHPRAISLKSAFEAGNRNKVNITTENLNLYEKIGPAEQYLKDKQKVDSNRRKDAVAVGDEIAGFEDFGDASDVLFDFTVNNYTKNPRHSEESKYRFASLPNEQTNATVTTAKETKSGRERNLEDLSAQKNSSFDHDEIEKEHYQPLENAADVQNIGIKHSERGKPSSNGPFENVDKEIREVQVETPVWDYGKNWHDL